MSRLVNVHASGPDLLSNKETLSMIFGQLVHLVAEMRIKYMMVSILKSKLHENLSMSYEPVN
jgi:hypothetical protein